MRPAPDLTRDGGPPTRLLVLRHGRSEWNAAGRWQGHADIALDRTGELQAAEAAEVLGGFDAIWSSDLRRAHRSAQIIAELLGVGPVVTDPGLREKQVGPWEGLTNAEVEQGWPGFLQSRRRPEGFEDDAAAAERVLSTITAIAAAHPGGEVLAVSHGGVIRSVRRFLGAPAPYLPNLSGAWFTVRAGTVTAGEVVHLLAPAADAGEAL